jgi:DNA-binding CsgD family transcriptional regulator
VLARTPTAPEGVKGISLFIVPKRIVNADGSLGEHNDIVCAGIEHKMGIHASPTCTMNYGEKGGAVGYLIGNENEGLKYMFIMMNAARFSVGVQGYSIADRAFPGGAFLRARPRAVEGHRGQGVDAGSDHRASRRAPHADEPEEPDRSDAFARVLHGRDARSRAREPRSCREGRSAIARRAVHAAREGVVDGSFDGLASEALQVFGGMGYVEETGVAQYYRDIRICQIYEGTTGIQSNDLLGRKFLKDNGKTALKVIGQIQATVKELEASERRRVSRPSANSSAPRWRARRVLAMARRPRHARALGQGRREGRCSPGAVPYLMLWGYTAGGWMMGESRTRGRQEMRTTTFYSSRNTRDGALLRGARAPEDDVGARARACRPHGGHEHDGAHGRQQFDESTARALALAYTPLIGDDRSFGVLLGGHRDPGTCGDRAAAILEAVAERCARALSIAERARAAAAAAVYEDRQRTAIILHDTVGAMLFAISSSARAIGENVDVDEEVARPLQALDRLADEAANTLRDSLRALLGSNDPLASGGVASHLPRPDPGHPVQDRRRGSQPSPIARREYDVLRRVATGETNSEIAHAMSLSCNTVKTYLRNVMSKLGARNRVEAIARAREFGFL